MQRWYQPVRSGGRADQKLQRIEGYVQNNRLAQEVPAVYFEKRARGEFYIFLAVDSETAGTRSANLKDLIDLLGHPLPPLDKFEEIKTMVSGEITTKDFARRIRYRVKPEPKYDDPFDFSAAIAKARPPMQAEFAALLTQRHNRLLYWLSTVKQGSWQSFKLICRILGLDDTGQEARRILRRLRLLGHIELTADGSRWYVCPPCLVKTGSFQYFLAGQRCGSLLADLKKLAGLEVTQEPQPSHSGPEIVRLRFTSNQARTAMLDTFGPRYGLGKAGLAGSKLTEALPDRVAYLEQYTPVPILDTQLYSMEYWQAGGFVSTLFKQQPGLYRLTHHLATDQTLSSILYYDPIENRWLRGDWYGLRYLALQSSGVECRVNYQTAGQRLALPREQRWPELYERALVLSSGRLPEEANDWLLYSNISPAVARQLATKLQAIYKES